MTEDELLTVIDGPIARMTFNRPHVRNALTPTMVTGMRDFLREVERDSSVRCVIMSGVGDHFMSGGDIRGFVGALKMSPRQRRRDFEKRALAAVSVFRIIERMPKPVIAKIRGAAAGASVGWVAASDFAIASRDAVFVVAHIQLGASPDGAVTWHLPRVVGLRKAKEMALLGDRLDADQALEIGLINRVVPSEELDDEGERLAQRLVAAPSYAVGRTKHLLNVSSMNPLARQMKREAKSLGACAARADFVEGVDAFIQKRRAIFRSQ